MLIDPFQHARHTTQYGWPDRGQVVGQAGDAAAIGDGAASPQTGVESAGTLESVRQGQKGQEQVFFIQRQDRGRILDVGQHIGMAQHDAFGSAGRARGVDDGCQTGIGRRLGRLCAVLATGQQVGQAERGKTARQADVRRGIRVEMDDVLKARDLGRNLGDFLPLVIAGHSQHARPGIVEDIGQVVRRAGQVERYVYPAQIQTGQIEQWPFGAVIGQNSQPVARLKA